MNEFLLRKASKTFFFLFHASYWNLKKGNVANQREHLILLLANMDVRKRDLVVYTQVYTVLLAHLMLSDVLDSFNTLNMFLNYIPYFIISWRLTKAYFSLGAALYRSWWIKSSRTIGHGVSTCVVNKILGKLSCCFPKL